MIQVSQLKMATDEQKRKALACRTAERGEQVYVMPRDETRERRIVIFLNEGILCISTDGTACPANDHKRTCYHALSAARRKVINAKRRRTIAMKKQGSKAA
jgi:hypothetical protein